MVRVLVAEPDVRSSPLRAMPSLSHWKAKRPGPPVVTESVSVSPGVKAVLWGPEAMAAKSAVSS